MRAGSGNQSTLASGDGCDSVNSAYNRINLWLKRPKTLPRCRRKKIVARKFFFLRFETETRLPEGMERHRFLILIEAGARASPLRDSRVRRRRRLKNGRVYCRGYLSSLICAAWLFFCFLCTKSVSNEKVSFLLLSLPLNNFETFSPFFCLMEHACQDFSFLRLRRFAFFSFVLLAILRRWGFWGWVRQCETMHGDNNYNIKVCWLQILLLINSVTGLCIVWWSHLMMIFLID